MALVKFKTEEFSELLAINKGTTAMGVCIGKRELIGFRRR
jgi:hypothetical protein